MSDAPLQSQFGIESQPPLPVRRLHNFIYCPRLFYFQWVENIFQESADTVAGERPTRRARSIRAIRPWMRSKRTIRSRLENRVPSESNLDDQTPLVRSARIVAPPGYLFRCRK